MPFLFFCRILIDPRVLLLQEVISSPLAPNSLRYAVFCSPFYIFKISCVFNLQVVAWRPHRPVRLGVAVKTFQSPLKREVLIRLLVRFPVSPPLTLGRVAASYVTVLCRGRA